MRGVGEERVEDVREDQRKERIKRTARYKLNEEKRERCEGRGVK